MTYLCYYAWGTDGGQQAEAIRRFKEVGGRPPRGVNLVGRWTQADFMGGVVVLEADDPKALTEFALTWSDVMSLKIVPALVDADLGEVLARAGK